MTVGISMRAKRKLSVLLCVLLVYVFSFAQNAIVTENLLTGNPASEWDINGAGDLSIQGFATEISVNKGQTVHFKINVTDAASFGIKIYRIGYYNGNGARLIADLGAFSGVTQPPPIADAATGLIDCGNWSESAHWDVPSDAVSGVYIARLTRNNGASHIIFIVRDDASHSPLYFKTSDATWQAYNGYGGNSLYVGNTTYPGGHATKVSYNRPFTTRNGGGGSSSSEDWFFNAEYPMIRWIERNGYDVTYSTDVDAHRYGSLILNHKVFLAVGHDEYWSAQQRTNIENARGSGVHLAFFDGNEIYWKTRWENSIDGNNTSYRTLVCYKEGTLGENQCGTKCDPISTVWTGLWRDGCEYSSADGCRPENSLSGQISWDGTVSTIQVPNTYKNLRFWRNTSIATLSAGQTAALAQNTLGYEWDFQQYDSNYPPGRIRMSETTVGSHTHHLSLYRHPSGSLIFGAGTVQWSWGLDENHDGAVSTQNKDMQQATVNLFADMGVQPATLQQGLIAATQSSDVLPPSSTITNPTNGSSVQAGKQITITGTAVDQGGGTVAGIEISTDGGTTWHVATGTNNWSYSWTPPAQGSVTIKSRSVDDIGNIEAAGDGSSNSVTVTITAAVCPCTIFQPTDVPATQLANDNNSTGIENGVKFQSNVNGYITGIRFYKGNGNTGTHIGHLWDASGNMLGQATFTNETTSGWQEVTFASPVSITANTTYIASCFSNLGYYAYTDPYFTQPVTSGYLTALQDIDPDNSGNGNGVYKYSSSSVFPDQNFQSSNYWIDVVFNTTVGPDVAPPSVVSTVPGSNASNIGVNTTVSATFSEPIDPSTLNSSTVELRDASSTSISSTINYDAGTRRVRLTPSSPLAYSKSYTATLKGGTTSPTIKDVAGNAMAANYTWTFATADPPAPPPTEGPGGPILVLSAASNPFSRYTVEILRAEGLNEFTAMDISLVNASILANYDVAILGNISLSASNVTMLSDWVNNGGTLIAFKPDPQLASLMGLTPAAGSPLANKYLLVSNSGPGAGIVNQSIQYHGAADLYTLNGATILATLYSNATTATAYPAVTTHNVGENGGTAIAFTYDLTKSIIYTRQGNPAWVGQRRDGESGPTRSDNLFFGNAAGDVQPDWIDFSKIDIPQADEQQRLLTNIILKDNLHRKPLPRFWFLPRGFRAAVVMTGDDHGNGGTIGRFNQYLSLSSSNAPEAVQNWSAIRGTSYIYPGTTGVTNDQIVSFQSQGFEIALHVNTGCVDWTPTSLLNDINSQSADFFSQYPGINPLVTNRTHCIPWSDWSSQPEIELSKGIRLDANYYYWPGTWIQDRPGMFTGSGMPMRFAKMDGSIIDCYQVATQMTDESNQTFPFNINSLLDKATGSEGYYGVFCANMHTDNATSSGSDAIVSSALAHQVPVVSAKQMLEWLDGRNNSSFGSIAWNNSQLSFTISAASAANNLKGMLPTHAASGVLAGITKNGSPVADSIATIKGIQYAFFSAASGNYVATYTPDQPPVITNVVATAHPDGTATVAWTTNEPSSSKVDYGTSASTLTSSISKDTLVTDHSVTLNGLAAGITYYFRVTSADDAANSSTSPNTPDAPLTFTTLNVCAFDQTAANFNAGTTGTNTQVVEQVDGEVILKPILNEDFSGTTIPGGWTEGRFDPGGTTVVNNGTVTVSGTHLFSNVSFAPGSSIEFTATFTSASFQNVGFSADQPFNNNPWVTIGQGQTPDGSVHARSSQGDNINLGSLLGTEHHYLIKWNAANFEIYVDGNTVPSATINLAVTQNMYLQISDVSTGDGALSVNWLRVLPYASPGSYTSRVFDHGDVTNWGKVSWTATTPAGTALNVFVRTGNTATPDGTWTNFAQLTNGGTVGVSSRYIQYRADLSTTDLSVTPVLSDIAIECSTQASAPVITNVAATPSADGLSATITWTTNENSDSRVDYGTSAASLSQNVSDAAMLTSHSVQLTGLTPGTTYYFRVTSADAQSNSAMSPNPPAAPLSFMAIQSCFDDVTSADFSQGTTSNFTYLAATQDGEVILKPAAASEFTVLPSTAEWSSFAWNGGGGTSTVSSGILTVSGARFNTEPISTAYGPGSTLEFVATFGAESFEHIGFGGGTDDMTSGGIFTGQSPWAMFSTNNTTNTLQARTFDPVSNAISNFVINTGTSLVGSAHKYRINWKTDGTFEFYVDDALVRAEPIAITSAMRPAISDFSTNTPAITVDWIHVTPYASQGTFESRILDAGAARSWTTASWLADVPAGTTLQLEQRQGNTAIPDGTWTAFTPISTNGATIGGTSRYIQYRANLATTNDALTPVVKEVHVGCSTPATLMGTVTLQGRPAPPNAQWQMPLVVSLYNGTTLINTYNVTSDQNGQFTIPGITPGTYTIAVKGYNTLRKVLRNQTLSAGTSNINVGVLIAGDANGDNFVGGADFSLLVNAYNKGIGTAGYDARADFNGDGFVTGADFSLLVNAYNQVGETP
jgi:hypothetical protein